MYSPCVRSVCGSGVEERHWLLSPRRFPGSAEVVGLLLHASQLTERKAAETALNVWLELHVGSRQPLFIHPPLPLVVRA